jgi:hypothetical protein
MVEGLRYGMLGTSALPPGVGGLMLALLALGSTAVAFTLLERGYKLKQ